MKMKSFVLVTLAALALGAPALAQQGTPPTPEERAAMFDKADVNKDGKLDFAEFKASLGDRAAQMDDARIKAIFDRRDTDKDGKLSKAEFMAPMQRPAQ